MSIGEVCDESFNDRANQDGRQRQCSENMAGTAFTKRQKQGNREMTNLLSDQYG